jgi:large repetitive protein
LNPDGSVDLAPNSPAGSYTLTYQICEIANPTNCDDAIVTITVDAPEIIANDDIAGGVNGYDGQTSVLNVFDNDLLNGNPVDPTEVTLTETVADPTGSLSLNPDGSVDVAPGTAAGTYTLTYEICEITNPTNCDDAIVTITVVATPIIANDDFASGVNGYDGDLAVLNVFDNDLLNGNLLYRQK